MLGAFAGGGKISRSLLGRVMEKRRLEVMIRVWRTWYAQGLYKEAVEPSYLAWRVWGSFPAIFQAVVDIAIDFGDAYIFSCEVITSLIRWISVVCWVLQ